MTLDDFVGRIGRMCEDLHFIAKEASEDFLKKQAIKNGNTNEYNLRKFKVNLDEEHQVEVTEYALATPSSFGLKKLRMKVETDIYVDDDGEIYVTGKRGLIKKNSRTELDMEFGRGEGAEHAQKLVDAINQKMQVTRREEK